MRPGWTGDDEHRGMATTPEGRRRGDGGLDALPTGEASRQHEERVGAVEVKALGHARARARQPERGSDIHAIRHDRDAFAPQPGERRELVRALVRHGDVANARVRPRDEAPRVAGVSLVGVLRIRPREIVGPRDHDTRALARESDERFRQR